MEVISWAPRRLPECYAVLRVFAPLHMLAAIPACTGIFITCQSSEESPEEYRLQEMCSSVCLSLNKD